MEHSKGVQIPLINSDQFALVDAEDAEFISQFEWFAEPHGDSHYVVTFIEDDEGGVHAVYMHDMVMAMHGRFA